MSNIAYADTNTICGRAPCWLPVIANEFLNRKVGRILA